MSYPLFNPIQPGEGERQAQHTVQSQFFSHFNSSQEFAKPLRERFGAPVVDDAVYLSMVAM